MSISKHYNKILYPEEIKVFMRCPRLFSIQKENSKLLQTVSLPINSQIIIDSIKSYWTYKDRKGMPPKWKIYRDIIDRTTRDRAMEMKARGGTEKLDLEMISMCLNSWYGEMEHTFFSAIPGPKLRVPINRVKGTNASLEMEIPLFYVDKNGISAVIYSPSIEDYRLQSLYENLIVQINTWGLLKYFGNNDQFTVVRVMKIDKEHIDFINLQVDKISEQINTSEISYILYGMSNNINFKIETEDCHDCIAHKECSAII